MYKRQVQGLGDVPGVSLVAFQASVANGKDSSLRFRLTAGSSDFGELAFSVTDSEAFAPYIDHIRNFSFTVALIMEERQQRRVIEGHRSLLEHQVAERTSELAKERDLVKRYLDVAGVMPVSYTHLDVYKRQGEWAAPAQRIASTRIPLTPAIEIPPLR